MNCGTSFIDSRCGGNNDIVCERKCEMSGMKTKYEALLEQYYVVFADFLKFNNARGNETYNQRQASTKQRELNDIQRQLTQIQTSLQQKIDATNSKINITKKEINKLDSELYEHNSTLLTQEKNIQRLRDEHASRMQQVNMNIEKNRYRKNVMYFFIALNIFALSSLSFILYKNYKK